MKYSNYIGVFAAIALIAICFVPWVYIPPIDATITGVKAPSTNFGRPGMVNIIMSIAATACFLIARVWAKRTNLFIAAFNMAWAIRNYLLITQCQMGECPDTKWGMYALLILSVLILLMSFLPKLEDSKL